LNTAGAKTSQFALREILLSEYSKEKLNFAGATSPLLLRSLTNTPEQIALLEILLLKEIQG
jgi:hypothetical protein